MFKITNGHAVNGFHHNGTAIANGTTNRITDRTTNGTTTGTINGIINGATNGTTNGTTTGTTNGTTNGTTFKISPGTRANCTHSHKLRVLHLFGSSTSLYYAQLSMAYAQQAVKALGGAAAGTQFNNMTIISLGNGQWACKQIAVFNLIIIY